MEKLIGSACIIQKIQCCVNADLNFQSARRKGQYQQQIYSLLPVVPHYPAVLYSSSGGRQPWIPLAVFEVILHLPLEAIKQQHHYCLSWVH